MSYIVFARKYRPKVFDEIIGQPHITTTLKNAISQDRVAHAYLFTGPRGVGKTTTARVLAKGLNCEKGVTQEPCNTCTSCNEITRGVSLDILEIDGASNRGIDEIRNLKESVKFAPAKGNFKVYIIDEVHMLTPEAFNALLKTLEEPPPHVKFIFATTQIHKVPPTILSRCQRFDFRRISTKDIFENLKEIVKKEGVDINDEALNLIAKYADGSLRDGQVILDQMISFTQGRVDPEDIAKILGIVDDEVLFGLSSSIIKKDPVGALTIIESIVNDGKDVLQVVLSLIEHFRNISVMKISEGLGSLIEAGPDKIRRYVEEAQKFTIEDILYVIYTLSNTIDFIKRSNHARTPLEAAMVKLTRHGPITSLAEIIEKIDRLEAKPRINPTPNLEGFREAKTESEVSAPKLEMDEISSSWNSVINYIKMKKMSVASYLEEGYPVSLESNVLSIGFPKEFQFHKEVLELPENKRLIDEAIQNVMKLDLKVTFILVEPVRVQEQVTKWNIGKETTSEDVLQKDEPMKKDVEPIVKSALDIFGGQILKEEKEKAR